VYIYLMLSGNELCRSICSRLKLWPDTKLEQISRASAESLDKLQVFIFIIQSRQFVPASINTVTT
jgi:hypothetical protein